MLFSLSGNLKNIRIFSLRQQVLRTLSVSRSGSVKNSKIELLWEFVRLSSKYWYILDLGYRSTLDLPKNLISHYGGMSNFYLLKVVLVVALGLLSTSKYLLVDLKNENFINEGTTFTELMQPKKMHHGKDGKFCMYQLWF